MLKILPVVQSESFILTVIRNCESLLNVFSTLPSFGSYSKHIPSNVPNNFQSFEQSLDPITHSAMTPFFRKGQTSVQNLTLYIIFLYGDVHIIWTPRNLQICGHSIFFNYWTKICLMGHWTLCFLLILVGDV